MAPRQCPVHWIYATTRVLLQRIAYLERRAGPPGVLLPYALPVNTCKFVPLKPYVSEFYPSVPPGVHCAPEADADGLAEAVVRAEGVLREFRAEAVPCGPVPVFPDIHSYLRQEPTFISVFPDEHDVDNEEDYVYIAESDVDNEEDPVYNEKLAKRVRFDFEKESDEGDLNLYYAKEEALIHDMLRQLPAEVHAIAIREVQSTAFKERHAKTSSVSSVVCALTCKTLAPMTFLRAWFFDDD